MNKYSNAKNVYGYPGQVVDLDDGMEMGDYGDGIDYYDEEDASGGSGNTEEQFF
jgi:hypothetical protein